MGITERLAIVAMRMFAILVLMGACVASPPILLLDEIDWVEIPSLDVLEERLGCGEVVRSFSGVPSGTPEAAIEHVTGTLPNLIVTKAVDAGEFWALADQQGRVLGGISKTTGEVVTCRVFFRMV